MFVIASAAKQSRADRTRLLRRSAPRNDESDWLNTVELTHLTADKLLAHHVCRWPGKINGPCSALLEPIRNLKLHRDR